MDMQHLRHFVDHLATFASFLPPVADVRRCPLPGTFCVVSFERTLKSGLNWHFNVWWIGPVGVLRANSCRRIVRSAIQTVPNSDRKAKPGPEDIYGQEIV